MSSDKSCVNGIVIRYTGWKLEANDIFKINLRPAEDLHFRK